jgi:hypothetical protein
MPALSRVRLIVEAVSTECRLSLLSNFATVDWAMGTRRDRPL